MAPEEPVFAALSLGGNMGDVRAAFRFALEKLALAPGVAVVATSSPCRSSIAQCWVDRFVRLGRAPCYLTWASKAGAVVCPLTLIPLLSGGAAEPFHFAVVWLVLAGMEEIAIALLVPAHAGEMPTVWHAIRLRRGSATGGGRG